MEEERIFFELIYPKKMNFQIETNLGDAGEQRLGKTEEACLEEIWNRVRKRRSLRKEEEEETRDAQGFLSKS